MIKVSIVVNSYRTIQGINSVVDQFLLNRGLFEKHGYNIAKVYDSSTAYYNILRRQAGSRAANKHGSIKQRLKSSSFYSSYCGQVAIVLYRYMHNGRKACSVISKSQTPDDILVSQDVFMSYYYLKSKGNAKLIQMTHMHSDELEQLFINYPSLNNSRMERRIRRMHKYVYENCASVVTICQSACEHVERNSQCRRTAVIYNSVQPSDIKTQPGTHSKIRFVLASSLTERKGIDLLCQVLSQGNADFRKSCEFHIFGDGNYFAELKALSERSGFDNLFVYGNRPNPFLQYGDKDVLLMTSRNETLPMSIIEAMSVGMPILSTNVGAIEELVVDGENGFLVAPSAEEITKGIRRVIENKDRLAEMGVNSHRLYRSRFSNEVWVDRFSELFDETLKSNE